MSKSVTDHLPIMTTYTHMTNSNHIQPYNPSPWKPCTPHTDMRTKSKSLLLSTKTGLIRYFPGEYKIHLNHETHPVIHTLWKCSNAMRPLVNEELDKMVSMGITTKVEEPTDSVSSFAHTWKVNGTL